MAASNYSRDWARSRFNDPAWREAHRVSGRKAAAVLRAKRKKSGSKAQGDWIDRYPEYVARAAKNGREYWPRGLRHKPVQKPTQREIKPWHGVRCKSEAARLRYIHDPKYRLYHRLKRWMHKHLRNGKPSRRWSKNLGYSVDELRKHLERQFTKGMSWQNMGEWHIDHIIPVSAFCFESEHDPAFKQCMGLPNLRPIWASENLRKGGRVQTLV